MQRPSPAGIRRPGSAPTSTRWPTFTPARNTADGLLKCSRAALSQRPSTAPPEEIMAAVRELSVRVNGAVRVGKTEPRVTLADFLRDELGLTGTHLGCEHGVCGACTILLDGRTARSCLMLAVQAHEHEITTVEGLASNDQYRSPLQEAFRDNHGLQCGFCTPGMLITSVEFLRDNPDPTEAEVRVAISGNLCRCTGYQNIVAAALDAAKRLQGRRSP